MRHLKFSALFVGAMLVGPALYAQAPGPTPAKGPTVNCKDGTVVARGRHACKDHGGYMKKGKKHESAAKEKKEEKKEAMKEEKREKKAAKKP